MPGRREREVRMKKNVAVMHSSISLGYRGGGVCCGEEVGVLL